MGRELRREMLDHVLVLNERHLRRLMGEYISYYHQDRVPDSLAKDTPDQWALDQRPAAPDRRWSGCNVAFGAVFRYCCPP